MARTPFAGLSLGQYYPTDSIIHRLDPRIKIGITMAYIAATFAVVNFWGFALLIALLSALLIVARLPARWLWRSLRPILYIVVFTLLIHALHLTSAPGEALVTLGPVKVTEEGLVRGLFFAGRLALLVVGTSFLTLTTSPVELTDGLEAILSPGKRIRIPAHELAMMMTIALRFIPTLLEEADKIIRAQMARGADFESGHLVRRARNYIPILIPLFVGAFRRADDLALAMEARGYRGGEGRTRLRELRLRAGDAQAVLVSVLLLALVAGVGRL